MTRPNVSTWLQRWGGIWLAAGGAAWAILGIGALVGLLGAIPGREDVVIFVLALIFTALGLLGVHSVQGGRTGALGRLGLSVALLAIGVRAAGGIAFLAGSLALERVSQPVTVGMLVGLVLYGVATFRAGVLPRWYGVALAAAMPISLPLDVYGTTLFGVVLAILGIALAVGSGRAEPVSPRVR
jgi:hypothetical protein